MAVDGPVYLVEPPGFRIESVIYVIIRADEKAVVSAFYAPIGAVFIGTGDGSVVKRSVE